MYSAHNIVRTHPRLLAAIVAGIFVWLVLPLQWTPVVRVLVGWNVTVWLYLGLMGWLMMRASQLKVRCIAEQEDQSAVAILAIMSMAAIVSMIAIVFELSTVKGLPFQPSHGSLRIHRGNCIGFMVPRRNPVHFSLCAYLLQVAHSATGAQFSG